MTNIIPIEPNSKYDRLARDLALFTQDEMYTVEEILHFSDIPLSEYAALQHDPAFIAAYERHRKEIGTTEMEILRARARTLAASLLRDTFEMARDPNAKPADRLKAAARLDELGDTKPKNEQQFSGMVLNVSFGSGTPAITAGVVEHE